MHALVIALALIAQQPKIATKAPPQPPSVEDAVVNAMEREFTAQLDAAYAKLLTAKRTGGPREVEAATKVFEDWKAGRIEPRPKLEPKVGSAGWLGEARVGFVMGDICVLEASGAAFELHRPGSKVGDSVAVGFAFIGKLQEREMRVGKRLEPVLYPVVSIVGHQEIAQKWAPVRDRLVASAAKKAPPPDRSNDDIAAGKLKLAKLATKPETRVKLLREIVENYPATPAAAEAEKLLAEDAKD